MDIEKLRQQINELLDEVATLREKVSRLENNAVTAAQSTPSVVLTMLSDKKKSDLKSKIGLNDRFRFVNELFGGNSAEFNAAINQLDEIDSMEEAEDYLDRLFSVYHWDKKGQAYSDFYQLIKQKITP